MILIPTLNPIPFSLSGVNEPQEANAYYRGYQQKYQKTDSTPLQFLVPAGDAFKDWTISAIDDQGTVKAYTFPVKKYDGIIAGYIVYEFTVNFSQFAEGAYRLILSCPGAETYQTDYICVKNEHAYTRLLSYQNSVNAQSVAFSTGIAFKLRVELEMYKSLNPKSTDSMYADERGGYDMLHSDPFATRRVNIGGTRGIPDWMIRTVNKAFSCNYLYLDSYAITKIEGAEFEAVEADNYNLRGWFIELSNIEDESIYKPNLFVTATWSSYYCDLTLDILVPLITRSGRPFYTRSARPIYVRLNTSDTWINTGGATATVLVVEKRETSAGEPLSSKTYNLLSAFPGYATLRVEQWIRYSDEDRLDRITAFSNYVSDLEGVDISVVQSNKPTETNTTACHIGVEGVQVLIDGNDNFVADSNNEYITEFQ